MWILDFCYDLAYFLYKSADTFKWDALIIYVIYQVGRRNGMRLFKRYLEGHFPILQSEDAQWKLWVMKQIESINGARFIPQKEYRGVTRSRGYFQRNGITSATSSPMAINQEVNEMNEPYIVVVDAGHGGVKGTPKADTGAVSKSGRYEKDFNLAVALKVEALFVNHPQVVIKLTRSTDVFIELPERARIANSLKAAAFISIHANSGALSSAGGTETLYTKDSAFAKHMHPYILAATGLKDRKAKYQNLAVGRGANMPFCLLEPGFLSNKAEEELLFSEDFQNRFAESIAKGLCAFLQVPYSVPTTPPIQTPGLTTISVIANAQTFTGYLLNGIAWIPARPVLNYLNPLWTFKDKQIILNGAPVETMLVDNQSYIKARDVMPISRVFFDNTTAPKRIDIFPLLEVLK